MHRFIILLALIFGLSGSANAQMPQWTKVRIPGDSVEPHQLVFLDSLHGYFSADRYELVPGPAQAQPCPETLLDAPYIWETTDGGKTWTQVTDTMVASIFAYFDVKHVGTAVGGDRGLGPGLIFFPTLTDRYITSPTPPYQVPVGQFSGRVNSGVLMHSSDKGNSWSPTGTYRLTPTSMPEYPPTLAALTGSYMLASTDLGLLLFSSDGGKTYPRIAMDSVFQREVWDTTVSDPAKLANHDGPGFFGYKFDNSDLFHWTIVRMGGSVDSGIVPQGLRTLISSDLGFTWHSHATLIPGQDPHNGFGGTLQYIKGTPRVYFFPEAVGGSWEGHALPCYICGSNRTTPDSGAISHSAYGINWLYSTDYGATWEVYRDFAALRRGFEAVRTNEVWITRRSGSANSILDPAFIISRTTDNGGTWDEDSTTLRGLETERLDGRIVTFSGPRHGWIAASGGDPDHGGRQVYIFRYDANEQPASVENLTQDYTRYLYKIYPNPSSEEVHLQIIDPRRVTKVEFYDLLGRQQYPPYTLEGSRATVRVHALSDGIYVTRISYQYSSFVGYYTLPLVVQH